MNMRVAFLVLSAFLFHGKLIGQVTMSQFIGSAIEAPQVKTFTDQLSYLQTKPYRLSALQKLEFLSLLGAVKPKKNTGGASKNL